MNSKILLCDNCKGRGKIRYEKMVDYHKHEYNYEDKPCYSCKGSGRIVETTVIKRRPYNPEEELE